MIPHKFGRKKKSGKRVVVDGNTESIVVPVYCSFFWGPFPVHYYLSGKDSRSPGIGTLSGHDCTFFFLLTTIVS